ncbi:MAG: DUF2461 domain-containing protein [Candidatus Alcyoniella australis]|nr:DUF2461 domain-containing protein [Candidatus Alcyoniella australis]
MEELIFTGFGKEGIEFLAGLERNNNKRWFDKRKPIYQRALLEPMQAFVYELGLKLSRDLAPDLVFEPRVNRSIYRIYRDTRFGADKSPYKTHMAAILWEGSGEKFYVPDFYFQFDAHDVLLGGGVYRFSPQGLKDFRGALADDDLGRRLDKIVTAHKFRPFLPLQGEQLKRVPPGYAADHPRAELLRHKGLYVMQERPISLLYTRRCLDEAERIYRAMGDLHVWLRDVLG